MLGFGPSEAWAVQISIPSISRRCPMFSRAYVVAVVCSLGITLSADYARAGLGERESYYMIVFSSQKYPRRARYSHTFATFVKVSRESQSDAERTESLTISWLPES